MQGILSHPGSLSLTLQDSPCRVPQSWSLTGLYRHAPRLVPGPGYPGVLRGQCLAQLPWGAAGRPGAPELVHVLGSLEVGPFPAASQGALWFPGVPSYPGSPGSRRPE